MRESLEVGRVLHEAEVATERHKRVPVEVPQGPAGRNAPRLVHVGDRSVPVAPRAVERNLPRAAEYRNMRSSPPHAGQRR